MTKNSSRHHLSRHRTLEEAALLVGSVTILCAMIKVSRSQYNNWKNRGDDPGYGPLVDMSIVVGISLERSSPGTEERNKCFINPGLPVKIWLPNLLIRDLPYLESYRSDRLMIVGTNRWLISGLTQANQAIAMSCKSKDMRQGKAITLDLEALLFGMRSLSNMTGYFNFLNSERISIVHSLEQLLNSFQGKWSDLHLDPSLISRYSKLYESPIDREKHLARIAGFNDLEVYYSIKEAYLARDQKLIEAMDDKILPIEPTDLTGDRSSQFLKKSEELCSA